MTKVDDARKALKREMDAAWERRSKAATHCVSWKDLRAWAEAAGVHWVTAAAVFRGAKESQRLVDSFREHFGFPMESATYARRSGERWSKAP